MTKRRTILSRPDAVIALPYQRLSGVEGDEISPQIQLKANLRTIQQLGLTCDPRPHTEGGDVYQDADKGLHSAYKRDNIPDWLALIERARTDPRVAAVVVYDTSRAFRNVRAMLEEAEQLHAIGVKLIRTRGGEVDLHSADGRRRAIDDANAAEYESRITSERLRAHYAELRDLDVYFSHIEPMGLRRSGKVPNVLWTTTEDFPTIVLVCELYADAEMGCERIAAELRRRGVTWLTRKGIRNPNVSPRTIHNVIRKIEKYKPFLDPSLYARVVETRSKRAWRKSNHRALKYPSLLLRGVLVCGYCGLKYRTTTLRATRGYKTSGGLERLYFHPPATLCKVRRAYVSAWKIDSQIWRCLDFLNDLSDADKDDIARRIVTPREPLPALDLRQHRERLEQRLRGYEQMCADGDISREQFRVYKNQIESELRSLPPPADPPRTTFTFESARELVEHLQSALRDSAEMAPNQLNQLMRLLFQSVPILDDVIGTPQWNAPFGMLAESRRE